MYEATQTLIKAEESSAEVKILFVILKIILH